MRRWLTGLLLVLAGLALIGCSDDTDSDESSTEAPPAPVTEEPAAPQEPIDPEAAQQRLTTVCQRVTDEDRHDECADAVGAAVLGAVEAGCEATTLDAWAEHIAASGFDTVPHDDFFGRCPLPLSNLILPVAPPAYRQVVGQPGTGLLDTDAVAAGFVASDEVAAFLRQIGHQVSYSAAWADGENLVVIRLDRFAEPEQAIAFLDSEHRTLDPAAPDQGAPLQIPGILQSLVSSSDDRHLVTGRVCEVTMTLIAQNETDGGLSTDEVVAWFSDQARRIQTVLTC